MRLLFFCKQDLNQLRNLSLDMTDEAVYRLQIQSSASLVYFSYLPMDTELQLTNPLDIKPSSLDVKPSSEPATTAPVDEKPPAPDAPAKRPLETQEKPEANKDEVTAEPEQKRMKTEEAKPEEKPPEAK